MVYVGLAYVENRCAIFAENGCQSRCYAGAVLSGDIDLYKFQILMFCHIRTISSIFIVPQFIKLALFAKITHYFLSFDDLLCIFYHISVK